MNLLGQCNILLRTFSGVESTAYVLFSISPNGDEILPQNVYFFYKSQLHKDGFNLMNEKS